MAIRKVSDLPMIENLTEKLNSEISAGYYTRFEVSYMSSYMEGDKEKTTSFESKQITFNELKNSLCSQLDIVKPASKDTLGGIMLGHDENVKQQIFPLSVDEQNKAFVQTKFKEDEWILYLSGGSAPITKRILVVEQP